MSCQQLRRSSVSGDLPSTHPVSHRPGGSSPRQPGPALALPRGAHGCKRAQARGDKALLSHSSDGHGHMQIGRLARHTRRQAPDLRGGSAPGELGADNASPARPSSREGDRALPALQRVAPGKGTGQYWGLCEEGDPGPGGNSRVAPSCGWRSQGRDPSRLQVTSPGHLLTAALGDFTHGFSCCSHIETGGEGAQARPVALRGAGTHRGQPLSHCHSGQQSHWP